MAVYSKFLSLINGVNRTVDLASNTLNVSALQIGGALLSGTTGSTLVGDAGGFSNFSPTAATIRGALEGIDAALAGVSGSAITALHGDASASGPGDAALTLATVNSNVGSFGSASSSVSFTVNAKGLVTAASASAIQIAESQVTNLVSDLAAKLSKSLAQGHIFVGNSSGVATDVAMSGEATIIDSGAVTLDNDAVIGKILTGYSAAAGTVDDTDSILSAIQKIDGNDALKILLSEKGAANGVATLDGSGHIPLSQFPAGVMEYKGVWDASTNDPTLADGTGVAGYTYRVSVAGTQDLGSGSESYLVGDLVIHNGSIWERSPLADGVVSVNGATGVVTVNAINQLTGDVTASAASGSQSKATTVAKIQGTTVSGTTGSGNVVFSAAPTLSGLLSGGSASFSSTIAASNFSGSSSGTNTGDISLGTANGLGLSGQVLSLQLASASQPGALSASDWSTFNNKLSAALTSAHIFVGNGSNLATDVAVSGDLSLANTGAFTISNAAVTLAKLASDSVDENKIKSSSFAASGALDGGSGTKIAVRVDAYSMAIDGNNDLAVQHAPAVIRKMVAGEAFDADTTYAVRMALNGESAGKVYKADKDASSVDEFWAFGLAYSSSAVSADDQIDVVLLGEHVLLASDSPFSSGDVGKPVFLQASGAFSITSPTSANMAIFKIGNVMTTTSLMVGMQAMGIN